MKRSVVVAVGACVLAAVVVCADDDDLVSVSPNPATLLLRPTDTPVCPPANTRGIYFDLSDGVLKAIDNACTEVSLEGAGGGGGAPTTVPYWTAAPDATLSAEKDLSALATGLVINTAGTPSAYAGVACTASNWLRALSAVGGSSCLQPDFSDIAGAATDAQIPNNITIALAATATALAANGGNCSGNNFALGVDASGVGECAQPAFSNLSGSATDAQIPNNITIDLATAATALAANPADCSSSQFATSINASGTLGCASLLDADIPDTITINQATLALAANALAADPADCAANRYATAINAAGVLTCGQVSLSAGVTGTLPLANITDDALDSLCLLSGGGSGDPFWSTCPGSGAPTNAEYIVSEANGSLSNEVAPSGANQVPVSSSSSAAAWGTVPVAAGGTGLTAVGVAYQTLRTNSAANAVEWGSREVVLASPVAVAVSASYVTVFTITPIASKTNSLRAQVFHAASATTVGMQYRVRSADAGNVGSCAFTHIGINATVASSVDVFHAVIAIASAPVDSASLASFSTAFNETDINCAWTSDGTPGDVILEAQLETGTTSTNILAGSSYIYMFN